MKISAAPLERGPVNYSSEAKLISKSSIKRSSSNEPSHVVKNKLAKTTKKVFLVFYYP